MCAISMAKIEELKFELIDHPLYSPDLAPRDFLFPNNCLKDLPVTEKIYI